MTAATIPTNMAILLLACLLVSSSGNAGFASEVVSLRQITAQEVADGELPSAPAPPPASAPSYADQAHDLLGFSRRVTSVDFDAHLANWDRDVEFDGFRSARLESTQFPTLVVKFPAASVSGPLP